MTIKFAKLRGARLDVLVIEDLSMSLVLTPTTSASLSGSPSGLAEDGVVRATVAGSACEAGLIDEVPGGATLDDWYLDHVAADGCPSIWCEEAVGIVAHYLWATGLERRNDFMIAGPAQSAVVTMRRVVDSQAEVDVHLGLSARGAVAPVGVGPRRRRDAGAARRQSSTLLAKGELSTDWLRAITPIA